MRKLICVAVAGLLLASAFTGGADARPGYLKAFKSKYTKVTSCVFFAAKVIPKKMIITSTTQRTAFLIERIEINQGKSGDDI